MPNKGPPSFISLDPTNPASSDFAEEKRDCLGSGQDMHQDRYTEGTCSQEQILIGKTLSVF